MGGSNNKQIVNKQQSGKLEQQPAKHKPNNKTQITKCKHQNKSTNN